jgi:hypothetical protein
METGLHNRRKDRLKARRKSPMVISSSICMERISGAHPESIADRMQRAIDELKILEQLILGGDFSPRLLSEFRSAVDSIRGTARVVQMWVGLQQQRRDPYSAMSTMAADRVRRAIEITKDLTIDLQSMEVDYETEGLAELHRAIMDMEERLGPIVKTSAPHKLNPIAARAKAASR